MKSPKSPDEIVLSDAQMRDVIERATRVVPEQTGITVAELRAIAAELDIDPAAFEAALDQVVGLPVPGRPVRSWLHRQFATLGRVADDFLPQSGRLIGCALFGGIAGWLNSFLTTFSINAHYPIALGMIGLTVANLLSRRRDRDLTRYLLETFATWGTYATLWSLTYGDVTKNLLLWVGLWSTLATVLGLLLVRARTPRDGQPPLRGRDAPSKDRATEVPSDHLLRARRAWQLSLLVHPV